LAQKTLRQNADLLYRHTGQFELPPYTLPVIRFSVRDPDKVGRAAVAAATAAAERFSADYRDIRLLKVHPDDTLPPVGASIAWDGRTLVVRDWSQESDFTGTSLGTCVLEG